MDASLWGRGHSPVGKLSSGCLTPSIGGSPDPVSITEEHPIAALMGPGLLFYINKNNIHRNQGPASEAPPAIDQGQNEIGFIPSRDEVAKRAYFNYLARGAMPGHEVQQWLEAETQLFAEYKRHHVHSLHR